MSVWKQKAEAKGQGEERELPPEGNQPAVLVGLIDLGSHWSEYQGHGSYRHKIYLVWELVEVEGRPLVGKDFTLSLHESSLLRDWLARWGKKLADGQEFDLTILVGKGCLLEVQHKVTRAGKTVANLASIGGLPIVNGNRIELTTKPIHAPTVWSLGDDQARLPDWLPYLYGRAIPDWIAESKERSGGAARHTEREASAGVNAPPAGPVEDTIPF